MRKRKAIVEMDACVACGCCAKVCPRKAITIDHGTYAHVNMDLCIGCGLCAKECPASIILIKEIQS